MIRITAHLHQDDAGPAHVTIYAGDDEPAPLPCGVLTMTAPEAAELVARIAAPEIEQTITPEAAAHVLWHYSATGGMEPGSFTQHLITTIDKADRVNILRAAAVWPGYAHAVHLAKNTEDGIRRLQQTAGQMLATPQAVADVARSVGGTPGVIRTGGSR